MVINLQLQLDEHRAKADREREPVAIHCDTVERELEAKTQVNHQLLIQIKVLREAQSGSSSWALENSDTPLL